MIIKAIALSIAITSTAFAISKKDKELADEYLSLPGTIQFIEVDPELVKLTPEEVYERLVKDGVIEKIKWRQHVKKLYVSHPDYDKLLETHGPDPVNEVHPELRFFDLENHQKIPGLP